MSSDDNLGSRRLIVVSNRLPVSITFSETGEPEFQMSSGGLVAALAGLRGQVDMIWLGSPGMPKEGVKDIEKLTNKLKTDCKCAPVWLDQQIAHEHYNLFSNEVLWPLFHYKENIEFKEQRIFESYTIANRVFCETVFDVWQPGDLVWVHDYHLMLLPKMLKAEAAKRGQEMLVAFFLHVPFPSSEVYRVLPEREKILDGVLHSDLIGFHTYDYARHFVHSCTRVLGLETTANQVIFNGNIVTVGVYPVGMDFRKFAENINSPQVKAKIEELKQRFKGQKVIIGVDRLDYIKGIPQKLQALERVFKTNPSLIGQVSLIQIAVPSREVVDEYQKLRREVETLVGHINTHYGDIGITPVHYLYKSVPFQDLLAMYSVADICLITSLRDGMNLVAQEFVACQEINKGVLILSEFAGSARCLAHAVRINPWNISQVAEAIESAIDMPFQERADKHKQLFNYVSTHAADHWGSLFVRDFVRVAEISTDRNEPEPSTSLLTHYNEAKKKLLIFAVDGVLSSFKIVPSTSEITPDIMESLAALDQDPDTDLVIISGRKKDDLQRFFGSLKGAILAAEHGYFIKYPGRDWDELHLGHGDKSWYDEILQVLVYYRDRTPGSSLEGRAEGKESTLMWNFRGADSEFGVMQAQELHLHLANHNNHNFIMDLSNVRKSIECRPKGLTVDRVLSDIVRELGERKQRTDFGFICYFGNEPPENEFQPIGNTEVYTCAVTSGNKPTTKFCVASQGEVPLLLRMLAGLPPLPDVVDGDESSEKVVGVAPVIPV
ncbi:hypothetical protein DIPPA_00126 [Diplonema papillatum]|nr:hypothetical protein DIPPA_00126 [Diplonema papillatum]